MDDYVHLVYSLTRNLPKEELYGITSQLRRSALSVVLNYIEGYARRRSKVLKNFLETSYGSLKESEYILLFCLQEKMVLEKDCQTALILANRIGGMLWGIIKKLDDVA